MPTNPWRIIGAFLRPWYARLIYGCTLVPVICLAVSGRPPAVVVVAASNCYSFLLLSMLMQVCLAEPRARLVPRYRQTLVAAAGLLALLPLALNSTLLFLSADSYATALGDVARVWALSASLAWLGAVGLVIVLKKIAYILMILVLFGSCIATDWSMPHGLYPTVAALLLWAFGVLAFFGFGRFLLSLDEEAFAKARSWAGAGANWSLEEFFRQKTHVATTLSDPELQRRFPAGNAWSPLLCRLRSASLASPCWITLAGTIIGVVGLLSLLLWSFGIHCLVDSADMPPRLTVTAFYFLSAVLPAISTISGLQRWTQCVERTALWPVSRVRVCAAIGTATGLQSLVEWIALVSAALLLVVLWQPSLLLEAWPWQALVWSFASVLFLSGVGAYLLRRCPLPILFGVLLLPLCALPLVSLFLCCGESLNTATALPDATSWVALSLILVALGLGAGAAAYRACTRGDWV